MAWEKRGNKTYLYQKLRIGGKVRSLYLGSGAAAGLLDRLETRRQESEKREEEKKKRERSKDEELDAQINSVSAINDELVDALFLINGYHQHKRQWRRKKKK